MSALFRPSAALACSDCTRAGCADCVRYLVAFDQCPAWLREVADAPETYVDEAIALRGASESIKRGEHRREEEK
jgi:hypothetical protein